MAVFVFLAYKTLSIDRNHLELAIYIIKDSENDLCYYFQLKERVDARNDLESYAYSLKNQIKDKEKLGGKLSDDDKETVQKAVDETISWLDEHQEGTTKEEYEAQKKKMEEVVHPIVSKLYPGEGGAPPPGGEDAGAGAEDKDEL